MKNDVAISVNNVTKDFHLPKHKSDSLKQTITQVFKPKEKGVNVHHALKGISFEVKKGEFFGVLGRNGSGKSTLLKIISEIYKPTSGTVEHNGTLVSFIELGVGFKAELSGRENVFLNGALLGFSKKEIEDMYDDIVGFAELEKFMDQKLKNYSSGMKVRLAFSVAIRAKADILILDEVLAVGDASFQKKCYEYFKSLKEDNTKTIVFVTHGMGAVREYCDRAILIEDGRILHQGAADEIADQYLKLFTKPSDEKKDESKNDRFGEGGLRIETATVTVNSSKVILSIDIRSDLDIEKDVIIGADIIDSNSKLIGGVETSMAKDGQLPALKKGALHKTVIELDNIFGTGDYYFTLSLKRKGNILIYDFWKKAVKFTNVNNLNLDGYFTVIPRFKINSK